MKKLLIVCGPTGTGKTSLAFSLAKKFNGELVSADSRQVYRGMDIGTGKDLPVDSKWQIVNGKWDGRKLGYWETPEGIRIWLLDLVEPHEDFSVAHWYRAAQVILERLWREDKLSILVGGTGLYIKAMVDGIQTIAVPRNTALRAKYEGKTADELFEILAQLDAVRAAKLNISDRNNPRRLIRAIEIAQFRGEAVSMNRFIKAKPDTLFIGLTAPLTQLFKRIDKRVGERVRRGAQTEIKRLFTKGVPWDSQAMTGLGYRQWREYFEGKADESQVIKNWKRVEREYARRQLTWFKQDKRIKWFDISEKNWQEKVESKVRAWYS